MNNFWETDAIRLRAVEPSDAEVFYRWNLDSERARYLDFVWPPTSLASVRAWVEEQAKKKLENGCFFWLIETCERIPVGTIATQNCEPVSGTFSYGVDVSAEHRRRGCASAAIRLVMHWYFNHLRYQKVTVHVHSDNTASLRLHEALGFQQEGRLRRMVFQNGQYLDQIFFGMTAEEFRARYGEAPRI
jgi:RimJ/RimL family protein N-acetyltransferase